MNCSYFKLGAVHTCNTYFCCTRTMTEILSWQLSMGSFFGAQAYGQSKLANILHARELARRLQV